MAQLEGMGFPTVRCQKALLATGNADAEAAMEWLFAHMDDPDIDAPIAVGGAGAGGGGGEPAAEQVALLADMGFSEKQERKALKETVSFDSSYLAKLSRVWIYRRIFGEEVVIFVPWSRCSAHGYRYHYFELRAPP